MRSVPIKEMRGADEEGGGMVGGVEGEGEVEEAGVGGRKRERLKSITAGRSTSK